MGIPTLTSFVNRNFKGWDKRQVKGKLIVDGYSLYHTLFRGYSSEQSEVYGGDYITLARELDNFFRTLLRAEINPLVVLDGRNEAGDITSDRHKKKIENIVGLLLSAKDCGTLTAVADSSKSAQSDGHVPHYLAREILSSSVKRVLGEGCLFVADDDADFDVASLGIHHRCPVLSNDSDFCLFPLLYGYIPYPRFHWQTARKNNNWRIYGEYYSYQLFCDQFRILDTSLLTVIPAIVGNDTIPRLDEQHLEKILPVNSEFLINRAVSYAAGFNTFEDCLSTLREGRLFDFIDNIQDAHYYYFFLPLFNDRNILATIFKHKNTTPLPEFLVKKYRQGKVLPYLMDVLWVHKVSLTVSMEDLLQESWCHLIGVPIRKALYGILCGSDVSISENQRCAKCSTYEEVKVTGVTSVTYDHNPLPLPTLQSCGLELENGYGKKVLFGVLGVKEENFERAPKNYELLLAVTCYWYKHCTINNKNILLKSFLLLLQQLMMHSDEAFLPADAPPRPDNSLFPVSSFTHAFAQWQSVYRDVFSLNQILQEPLVLLPVSKFLECSYLYSIVKDVKQRGASKVAEQMRLDQNMHLAFCDVICPDGQLN